MHHVITNVALRAKGFLGPAVRGGFHHPAIRLQTRDVRQSIGIGGTVHQPDLTDKPDGLENVLPFHLREFGRGARALAQCLVTPQQNSHRADPGGFLQKSDLPGAQIVEPAGDNHWFGHKFNHG